MLKTGKTPLDLPQASPENLTASSAGEYAIRGWSFYAVKEYQKAEADLRESLRLDPDDLDTHYALGLVLKASGQKTPAVETFRKVVELTSYQSNPIRARMVRRLAVGQIHDIETGEWNLEKETWQTKR
jgi:tetratricopeptide (TPR) repeat protein